ncbi:MAG: hypothetical protein Q8O00_12340 [Holophaga sp.]|nr:hypothetical protein [Holophaga sp.]
MSILALALMVVTLLSRLPLLLLDRPIKGREAILSWALQVVMALAIAKGINLNMAWLVGVLAASHAALHWLWWRREQRRKADLQRLRMAMTLGLIFLVTILASPWSGLVARDHRPWLSVWSTGFAPLALAAKASWSSILAVMTGLLLCMNEANALIRWVIERMSLRPKGAHPEDAETLPKKRILELEHAEVEYKRGRLIGVLERVIIFALVLGSQYAALAFVLTAKTMARFKSLEDRDFAEYFLLGTLMSVVLAGAAGLIVKRFLQG